MDVVSTLIRSALGLIHILAAMAWAGGGLFLLNVISPTVRDAGPDGGRFMQRLAASGRVSRLFASASIATVLTGVILYALRSGWFANSWPQSAGGIVLTLGALIGLAAFFHGLFATGPLTNRMGALAREMMAAGGPPSPQQMQEAQALGARMGRNAVASTIMVVVALFLMSAAQYVELLAAASQ